MPEYDFTQSLATIPTHGLHITHLDAVCRMVSAGKLASTAHYLHRLEATGRNVPRLLAIAARELKLKERR